MNQYHCNKPYCKNLNYLKFRTYFMLTKQAQAFSQLEEVFGSSESGIFKECDIDVVLACGYRGYRVQTHCQKSKAAMVFF